MIESFTGKYAFLSNFYRCMVEYDGKIYPSVEHAYQAAKTLDEDERNNIWNCVTAGQAKREGRKVTLRKDWGAIQLDIMYDLLRKKFKDPYLRTRLIDTGVHELVEGNYWGDQFWGIYDGKGLNWLGKLLMKVREEAKNGRRSNKTT